jgi:hypothetical protein
MYDSQTYTIIEAAKWLTENSKSNSPKTERHVLDLAVKQMLPICFQFQGELFNVSIKYDGVQTIGNLVIPFMGLVRSLNQPKRHEDYLTATLCQIVSVDSMKFERKNGICTKGYQLPTEYNHGGDVKQGYLIEGWMDFVEVPREDWLFHIDDLKNSVADNIININALPTTQAGVSSNAIVGVTKRVIMQAFQGVHFNYDQWGRALGDVPQWLIDCRVALGSKGKRVSHTWNPVLIGVALMDKGIKLERLDSVFRGRALNGWEDEWMKATDLMR